MSNNEKIAQDGPLAPRTDHVDTLHGVEVADPYRWMEDAEHPDLEPWLDGRHRSFVAWTDALTQRDWLYGRLQTMLRYDDESPPRACLTSERAFFRRKRADQDKWTHWRREADGTEHLVLDPNTWEETETVEGFYPSPDGRHVAYGVSRAGNEAPVVRVLDVERGDHLPDTLAGWKQRWLSWRGDGGGFFYNAHPNPGDVAQGDEFYWSRSWYHELGTQADDDQIVFCDRDVREHYHFAFVSEDGRWLVLYRTRFHRKAVWLCDLQAVIDAGPVTEDTIAAHSVPLAADLDADRQVTVAEGRIFVTTDQEAPNYRVLSASVENPGALTEIVAEAEHRLRETTAIDGRLYLNYLHRASTAIRVHDLDGRWLHDVALPTLGTASVWGHVAEGPVWLRFESMAWPPTVHTVDPDDGKLTLYRASPLELDAEDVVVEQVEYPSRDGTVVTMFVAHRADLAHDGQTPMLLTGYGGFDVARQPMFVPALALWVEAGGAVAIANLRGGGEYGRSWHEAGRREHKQNVFDDFIAAAEYLEREGWTSRQRLAIVGGSNGGLLTSAVTTQRPELFAAVLCQVPLTDMIRFHHLGLANIWADEYGSADDPEMFPHLLAYSPYHNVTQGTDYPAIVVTGSLNDSRTHPVHAMKFAAAVRHADADHGAPPRPILLHIQRESGHQGGVTIDTRADQAARNVGFLMAACGLDPLIP